jgi:hypothetical protein
MQHDAAAARRSEKLPAFFAAAGAPAAYTPRDLQRRFAAVWRLPWDNCYKELFWRLPLDGVAIYGSPKFVHPVRGCRCCCGTADGGREHNFWQCPPAAAVRRSLAVVLVQLSPSTPLLRRHIWLADPPLPSVCAGVWQVVALSALCGMDAGRRLMAAVCGERQLQVAPDAVVRRACVKAVDTLWALVSDFARLNSASLPRRWSPRRLALSHPFMHASPLGVGVHGLRVTQPPAEAGAAAVAELVVAEHFAFVQRLAALPNSV